MLGCLVLKVYDIEFIQLDIDIIVYMCILVYASFNCFQLF